jgi:hypothetical protein
MSTADHYLKLARAKAINNGTAPQLTDAHISGQLAVWLERRDQQLETLMHACQGAINELEKLSPPGKTANLRWALTRGSVS